MEKKAIAHLAATAWERVKDQINAIEGAYVLPMPGQIYAIHAADDVARNKIYFIIRNAPDL